jgi:hypothetical protein
MMAPSGSVIGYFRLNCPVRGLRVWPQTPAPFAGAHFLSYPEVGARASAASIVLRRYRPMTVDLNKRVGIGEITITMPAL